MHFYRFSKLLIATFSLILALTSAGCDFTVPKAYNQTLEYYQIPCGVDVDVLWSDILPIGSVLEGYLMFVQSSIPSLYFKNSSNVYNGTSKINIDCGYIGEDIYMYIRDYPETYRCRTTNLNISRCGDGILDKGEVCDKSIDKSNCDDFCFCRAGYKPFGDECCEINKCVVVKDQIINISIDLSNTQVEIQGDITFLKPTTINERTNLIAKCIYGKVIYDAKNANYEKEVNPIDYKCNLPPDIKIVGESMCVTSSIITRNNGVYNSIFIKFDPSSNTKSLGERLRLCNKVSTEKDKKLCGCEGARVSLALAIVIPGIVIIVIVFLLIANFNDKLRDKIYPWRKSKKDPQ